jgi:hypothetical protein
MKTISELTSDELELEQVRRSIERGDLAILRLQADLANSKIRQAARLREFTRQMNRMNGIPENTDLGRTVSIAPDPGPIPLSTPSTPST